jgi:hypothetical protein
MKIAQAEKTAKTQRNHAEKTGTDRSDQTIAFASSSWELETVRSVS